MHAGGKLVVDLSSILEEPNTAGMAATQHTARAARSSTSVTPVLPGAGAVEAHSTSLAQVDEAWLAIGFRLCHVFGLHIPVDDAIIVKAFEGGDEKPDGLAVKLICTSQHSTAQVGS